MKTTDTPKTDAKREAVAMTPTALMDMTDHAREMEIQRNELLACMEYLRDVITDSEVEYVIEYEEFRHENGTPIEWLDWCLHRVSQNSLENT